jgi:hypothetical protein
LQGGGKVFADVRILRVNPRSNGKYASKKKGRGLGRIAQCTCHVPGPVFNAQHQKKKKKERKDTQTWRTD